MKHYKKIVGVDVFKYHHVCSINTLEFEAKPQ